MSEPDIRRLRIDDEAIRNDATRGDLSANAGAPCLLVTVISGAASVFCSVSPRDLLGTETAGLSGTLSSAGDNFLALNLGPNDPTGKQVLVTRVSYRWVFRY